VPISSFPGFNLRRIPEIALGRAPLEKVLTQVQFSLTPTLVSDEGESQLASFLPRYPVRRRSQSLNVSINPGSGTLDSRPVSTRIFSDQSSSWTVTVFETAVGIETNSYVSRDDFCQRVLEVLSAVSRVASPPIVDRVGVRYIDRISDPADLERLDEYVNPRLRIVDGAVDSPVIVEYSVSESTLHIASDERLKIRCGVLPPAAAIDPVIPPLQGPSWVLDLDVFTVAGGIAFDPASLVERIRRYSEHVYSFFRWATTEEFQNAFENRDGIDGSNPI
jgi:uncharacterized protein (TIGR04255 family)